MKNKKTIMAFGAHHDDVELRCGGTLANYVRQGWNVIYTIATTTPYYRHSEQDIKEDRYPSNKEIIDIRKREAEEGAKILGISDISFFDFKSLYWYEDKSINLTHFDGIKNTCEDLARIDKEIPGREYIVSARFSKTATNFLMDFILSNQVDILLTHSADDVHWEHYAVAGFAFYVCKLLASKGKDIKLFHWPHGQGGTINSSFAPTRFIDISDTIDIKCKAVSVFKSQYPDRDTSRFVDHIIEQAKIYGKLCGFDYAEAFMDSANAFKENFSLPATYDATKAVIGID
ncbi:PIG-L family deacetylase [bacterium]|nr:PIG-L family deacetylase [bacterium]